MPHFQIDYSRNLEQRIDMPGLCLCLRDAAALTGVFPLAGIRIRATACDHVVIADGHPDHAFLDLSVRLRGGRDFAAKERATEAIFDALKAFCAQAVATSSVMLSMEMRDIDPRLSPKHSSIRDHLSPDYL